MTAVAAEELGAEITALIARVSAGEEVVITERDVPRAKLVLLEPRPASPRRVPGRWKGAFAAPPEAFAPLTDEELKDWGY